MPRLLLVDGHAFAYRAFHALRSLSGPDGRPTNAIFGFIQMVTRLRAAVSPSHAAVIWDGGLAAERRAAWPDYKAQRPPMPDALAVQLDEIQAWLQAARVASGCRDGVEADDWIAALARWAERQGWSVVIGSADKDFMQLVSERIGLLNTNDPAAVVWTAEQVRNKTGVEPGQIVDWLSLVGDRVDNIPGVPGVGPKTAAELLRRFGSVARLYERLDEVASERLRTALRQAAAEVARNQTLVRLDVSVPCGFTAEDLAVKPPEVEALRALYARWGFRSLRAGLESAPVGQAELF